MLVENKLVQIGVAAGELEVSVDTIRRWAKQGLIKASRDGRGNRLFNVAEIERLQRKLSGSGEEKPFTVPPSVSIMRESRMYFLTSLTVMR